VQRSFICLRGALVGASLMFLPAVAAAQAPTHSPATPDDPAWAEADRLEAQALAAWDQNHPAEALPILERSVLLPHRARTTAQLGLLEARLGRWVRAEAHVTQALAAPDPWVTENRERIERALERIRSRVASLELECNVVGATVWIADEQIGTLPHAAPLRVPVGTTPVEVRAAGYRPVVLRVTVDAGLTAHERALLTPEAPPVLATPTPVVTPVAPAQNPAPTVPTARIVAWTSIGVGTLMLVGGGVSIGIRESAAARTQSADCAPTPGLTPIQRCPDDFSAVDATTISGAVLFGGAALFAGVAAVLFATSGSSAPRSAAIRCGGGPGDIGLACAGVF
jgi:hypothetical protein